MISEDNTFDFIRKINGLESAVNTFYNYFKFKNIQIDASYINCFDKIINPNEYDEFFHNELLLNKNKEINEKIIPNFENYQDYNIETESKVVRQTTDTITKIKDSPNNVNNKCKLIQRKYSCIKCGNLYANTDGVRKHWRKKHSEFKLKRGNIDSYTKIIFQTYETDNVDKAN